LWREFFVIVVLIGLEEIVKVSGLLFENTKNFTLYLLHAHLVHLYMLLLSRMLLSQEPPSPHPFPYCYKYFFPIALCYGFGSEILPKYYLLKSLAVTLWSYWKVAQPLGGRT
jgi:hypothetical protein